MVYPQHIVGICGGSGSGKTTFVRELYKKLSCKRSISLLSLDNYYKNIQDQQMDPEGEPNFDLPSALFEKDLVNDIKTLKNGQSIEREEYKFNVDDAHPTLVKVDPAEILLVEGLFVMHYPEVFSALTSSVFIEVDDAVQLRRRIGRDQTERGYSKEQIMYQWNNHVLPCYQKYLKPYKTRADWVIANDHFFESGMEKLVHTLSD